MHIEIFGEKSYSDEPGQIDISLYGPGFIAINVDAEAHKADGVVLTLIRARQLIYAIEAMMSIAEKEARDFACEGDTRCEAVKSTNNEAE